jgi:aminoglycoside phosphotransferase (APT) family kinase protein
MELVDAGRLGAWLDSRGIEVGRALSVEPLTGGSSNVMFRVNRGERRWVLRRPSKVALDRANDGMHREYRILEALGSTQVPHPAVVALCDDHDVLGCTFFLMELVEGVNPIPLPPAFDDDGRRAEIAYAMVDALVRVHQVDYRAVGLGDLGHPERFHERQVDRWSRQLASYQDRDLPGIEGVMDWLEANRPTDFQPGLMHGDFHMLNALIAPDPPGRVVAVLDWETATIGDPLLDLAGFCEVWCPVANQGWPSRHQLVEHYRTSRHLDWLGALTYYDVLYNFRLTVLLEGIYQRSRHDPTRTHQYDIGERALDNLARAVELTSDAGPGGEAAGCSTLPVGEDGGKGAPPRN